MVSFLILHIAVVTWGINSQLVSTETLKAIQTLSTSMNNWHSFSLLDPDISVFSTEESSFHATYFG